MLSKYIYSSIPERGYYVLSGKDFKSLEIRKSTSRRPSPKFGFIPPLHIAAHTDLPFIHLDVTIPFGEELAEETIAKELKFCLGETGNKMEGYRWSEYFRDNTSQGTKHRVLISYFKTAPETAKAGHIYPMEAALINWGIRVAENHQKANTWTLIENGSYVYSIIILSNAPFHILKLKKNRTDLTQRLSNHLTYAKKNLSEKKDLPLICIPDPAGTDNCDWSELKKISGLQLEYTGNYEEDLHKSLSYCLGQNYDSHNLIDVHKTEVIVDKNYIPVLKNAVIYTILLCALLSIFPLYSRHRHHQKLAEVNSLRDKVKEKLSRIQELSKSNKAAAEKLAGFDGLSHEDYPISHFFKHLGQSLPEDGEMTGIVLKRNSEGYMEFQFEAEVVDWNSVADFKEKLETPLWISSVVVSDQKKVERSRKVTFNTRGIIYRM